MTELPHNDPPRHGTDPERGGIGEQLRQAREARGLSVADLARSIKLEPKVIENLESDAYDKLPPPAFVRGYLRAIAKEFGIDSAQLIATFDMYGAVEAPELADFKSRAPVQITSESSVIRYTTVVLCIVMIIMVALWWRSHRGSALDLGRVGAASDIVPAEPATPLAYDFDIVEHPDIPYFSAPAEPIAAPEPDRQDNESPSSTVDVGTANMGEAPSSSAEPAVGDEAEIVIRAKQEAWVDVADASGRRLYFDLARPDRELRLRGEPPYKLVIGNAAAVEVEFRGQPVAIERNANEGVARFQLGR